MMISHDLSVLADVCDRLAVMYAGRLVEVGPSRQVFRNAVHPYSQALAAAFPTVGDPASRRAPPASAATRRTRWSYPAGCSFHPRCPVALDSCAVEPIELRPAGERVRLRVCTWGSRYEPAGSEGSARGVRRRAGGGAAPWTV